MATDQEPTALMIGLGVPVKPYRHDGSSISEGKSPRLDYDEIAARLGHVRRFQLLGRFWYSPILWVERELKFNLLESFCAARSISNYRMIFSLSERSAIPLSMLLSVFGQPTPHVVVTHHISSVNKSRLFRIWPVYKTFSHFIAICRSQASYLVNRLGCPESQVDFVYNQVDQQFFHPTRQEDEAYIIAVGQEQRDYKTLVEAIQGTDLRLLIVASSPWSDHHRAVAGNSQLTVLSHISYQELRALYAKARVAVVPLFDVDYAAGVSSVLESMAMGKPVVVSHSRGIDDYIIDGETGIWVPPGNPNALRETILSLWENPRRRLELGTNARRAVEERMNLDIFAERVARIICKYLPSP